MAKVLIIGGGVAGLSAAIYARKNGHEVTVCERQKTAGGNLMGWQRGEYHIDNCIHWLTGTNPHTETHQIWKDLGALGNVDVYQPEALYVCEADEKRLALHKNLQVLQRDMLVLSPMDEKEILALISAIEKVQGLLGIRGDMHDQRDGLLQKIKNVPSLLRYLNLSVGDLSKRFKHPLIQKFLVCMLGQDFGAIAFLVTAAVFCGKNGGLPQGGSRAMARRIAKRFHELGGKLLLGKNATKITVENGLATSVSFSDGSVLEADYVVCACEPTITFQKLLSRPLPAELQKQYDNPKMKRFSAYHAAFSCNIDDLEFQGDFIFELPKKHREILHTDYLILREFSHEKSFAPAGKTVLQTLTFCNKKDSEEWIALRKHKSAYLKKKEELSKNLQAAIFEKFPRLKGKIDCLDVWTPATYERYTGSETGSFMSFLLPKKQLPVKTASTVKGIENLFLATQWQQAPGGLPTAAELGKRAALKIEKKETARRLSPAFPFKKIKQNQRAHF